jgi:hypothetical protein
VTRAVGRLARLLGIGFGLCALALALLALALFVGLRAVPGEWSKRVSIGPLRADLGVLALVRVATHPLGMRALDGRHWNAPIGRLQFRAASDGATLHIVCDPCHLDSARVSSARLALPRVEATVRHSGPNDLQGELRIGSLPMAWRAELRPRDMDLALTLADAPLAEVYAIFAAAIPELGRARIEGRAGLELRVALASGRYALKPRIDGLAVSGLGTEALLSGTPLPSCAMPVRRADAAAPFGAWLPKAVVAAEDQRFHEHAGYDLAEMTAAWNAAALGAPAPASIGARGSAARDEPARATAHRDAPGAAPLGDPVPAKGRGDVPGAIPPGVPAHAPGRDGALDSTPRGASTLSQQLAKLLYTGDERSLVRKLRELLYAGALGRTLGKPRLLATYLAIAPWGEGRCGAQAAALHHFGKRAASLSPLEAAWLASLLRNPDAELRRAARERAPDLPRLEAILAGMQPLSRVRREALAEALATWVPPAGGPAP